MHCSQHQLERVLRSHFSFYAAYFPTVFEYFSLFSVHDELCRGFRGPGEVHAPNVFSSLKMTVQLSFLKAQPLANHSFQQILECREIPETMKARPYQNFFDNPWWGLAGERKAMATPRKTANAADRPFPLLFSIQKSSLLPRGYIRETSIVLCCNNRLSATRNSCSFEDIHLISTSHSHHLPTSHPNS